MYYTNAHLGGENMDEDRKERRLNVPSLLDSAPYNKTAVPGWSPFR